MNKFSNFYEFLMIQMGTPLGLFKFAKKMYVTLHSFIGIHHHEIINGTF